MYIDIMSDYIRIYIIYIYIYIYAMAVFKFELKLPIFRIILYIVAICQINSIKPIAKFSHYNMVLWIIYTCRYVLYYNIIIILCIVDTSLLYNIRNI